MSDSPPRRSPEAGSPLSSTRLSWGVLLGLAVASRIAYHAAGVRFFAGSLDAYIQYVDTDLLRTRLLESLFYLHDQPPAFNLFLGVVLKLFPAGHDTVFHAAFLVGGLALAAAMFTLLLRLHLPRWLALGLALLASSNPTTVLYENWLLYEHPVAVLLCLSLLFLHRFADHGRRLDGLLFFSFGALVCFTRGTFHVVWLGGVLIATLVLLPARRRAALLCAAGPLALVLALYLKNLVLFGSFGTGAVYAKLNFAQMTTFRLPMKVRRERVAKSELSPLALTPYLHATTTPIHKRYVRRTRSTGIPILDRTVRYRGGMSLHSLALLEIADVYLRDARSVHRRDPRIYWSEVRQNLREYTLPACETLMLHCCVGSKKKGASPPSLQPYFAPLCGPKEWRRANPMLGGLFVVLIGFGAVAFLGSWWAGARTEAVTFAFIGLTILWVTVPGILLSHGDQNRYRTEVGPLFWALGSLLIWAAYRHAMSLFRRIRRMLLRHP